ncbi:MAG: RagB/SusD family nutrient uptake outer membrane protein [Bacteroidales bacterium]|nr:RagB/SusD family nutrient uptake outer membrane protein [Bacteroidales bacterium]
MKFKHTITGILLLMLIFSSCGEKWLEDTVPYGVYDASGFVADEASAIQLLDGVYANLLGRDMNWTWFVLGDCLSDDSESGGEAGGGDTPEFQAYSEFRANSAGGQLSNFWDYVYSGIFRANATINTLDGTDVIDEQMKNRLVAEAKFLRAIYHFKLMRTFGPVPYIDRLYDPAEYADIPRTPIAEMLHAMQSDMTEIFDDLPGRASSGFPYKYDGVAGDDGRPGKDAARALLIKLLVFESSYSELAGSDDPYDFYSGCEDKWSDVRTLADNMIDSADVYGIGLDPDFSGLWRVRGENSDEIIWKINHSASMSRPGTNLPGASLEDAYWNVGTDIVKLQTVRQAAMIVDGTELTDFGWGWNCPTQNLVDAFDPADPRLDISVIADGDTIEVIRSTDEPVRLNRLALALPSDQSPTGYNHRKYEYNLDESGQDFSEGTLDVKVIRYADVLLWAAEANLKAGGNSSKAVDYVNRIRTRARQITTPEAAEPANISSITLEELYDERRRELAFESHRFFDLRRWGLLDDKLDGYQVRQGIYTIEFEPGRHEYLPIPEYVITETNGIVTQTPGYN